MNNSIAEKYTGNIHKGGRVIGMKVTVLGGGNTGCVMAAEFSLRGFEVTLFEERQFWNEHIDGILDNGNVVTVKGNDVVGDAYIPHITSDLGTAVADAEAIFISMVAWRHDGLIEELAPLLHNGQRVIFSAGNFASIKLRKRLGNNHPAIVGEMMGNIFPCRMVGPHTAVIAAQLSEKMVAAFPATDTGRLIDVIGEVIPCTPAKTVFEAALNAPNVVVHLAASLMNIANAEKDPHFGVYKDGLSPSVVHGIEMVEAEKKKVMDLMGYKSVVHSTHMKRVMTYDQFPELDMFRSLEGPNSVDHRYISEDASCGDCLILSLAQRLDIEMPFLHALVTIASGLNGKDYLKTGITMDSLGIPGSNPDEINAFLTNAQ